jgi:hypothetical protein
MTVPTTVAPPESPLWSGGSSAGRGGPGTRWWSAGRWWWSSWRARPGSRNLALLAAVAVGFFLLQLGVTGSHFGYGWDESVYLSMADPSVPDAFWSPWRAWGTALLTLPVAYPHAPVAVTRLYLMGLSSTGLYLAFRAWLAIRDSAAVAVGAGIFATIFVTVYYGPQVMPNYYVALGSVAATGLFLLARRRHRSRRTLVALAAAIGFVGLVRPSDSVWLTAGLGLAWLALPAWRRWRLAAAVVAGEIAGWIPWIVEAYLRFGGPGRRWRLSSAAVGDGFHADLRTLKLYLRMSGGLRLMCYCEARPALAGHVNLAVLGWWGMAGVLALAGIVVAWRTAYRWHGVVATVVAASLAFSYLWILRYAAARFLLPAFALAALPMGESLVWFVRRSVWSRRWPGWIARRGPRLGLVGALLVAHVGLQLNVLRLRMPGDLRIRDVTSILDTQIRAAGITPPCLLVGVPTPMLLEALPCRWNVSGRSEYLTQEPPEVRSAREHGAPVGVITYRSLPATSYLRGWRVVPLTVEAQPGWRLYLPPTAGSASGAGTTPDGTASR